MSKIRTCYMCKNQYRYCPRCEEFKDYPTFYFAFCSKNCRDIENTVNQYVWKHMNKTEARKALNFCDLSRIDNYNDDMKEIIEEILTVKTRRSSVSLDEELIVNED